MCLKRGLAMRCRRCGAIMIETVPLQYHALFETAQGWEEPTFHCIICGEYVDRTILRNREAQALACGMVGTA